MLTGSPAALGTLCVTTIFPCFPVMSAGEQNDSLNQGSTHHSYYLIHRKHLNRFACSLRPVTVSQWSRIQCLPSTVEMLCTTQERRRAQAHKQGCLEFATS